ncbi:MAG: rhomboid family intramembrane serine protease [Alphaproteobacteria bacterium]
MIPLADHNPTHTPPVLTFLLIALCVVAFGGQTLGPNGMEWSVFTYGFIPVRLLGNPEALALDHDYIHALEGLSSTPWQTLFTSMFLHGSLMHLGGNMLYLWVFGDNVENALGRAKFILFYLLGGLAAAFSQAAIDPSSMIPMVGASGAISAVLGAYMVMYPNQRITVLIPQVGVQQVPALIVLGLWFGTQLLTGLLSDASQGGVAFWAHIGGFVAGVVLVKIFQKKAETIKGG